MKNLAVSYYQKGNGCSQCILKAYETKYNVRLDSKVYNMSGAINSGFGIGGMCSVVIACIMVIGLVHGDEGSKSRRLLFLEEFKRRFSGINCGMLISRRRGNNNCEDVVYGAAEILESVLG